MRLPFTVEQFFEVFRRYNEAVWPAQWALVLLALVAMVSAWRGRDLSRTPALVLAVSWLWMGSVYHFGFFQTINPAAVLFGGLFVLQALLFLWYGVARRRLTFAPTGSARGIAGAILMAYALVLYPLSGWVAGHRYPETPTFGLPCPTTIFTLGLLLWARTPIPGTLLVIPALWAVIGTSAAVQLGATQDFALLPAALITVAFWVASRQSRAVGPHNGTPVDHGMRPRSAS